MKRGRSKNACRKNGEASDAAVAAPGPYRPPPTPDAHSLGLAPSSTLATASTPMTSKRFHARTHVHLSFSFPLSLLLPHFPCPLIALSLSIPRSYSPARYGRACARPPRNVRGSSISAAREFDGAGRVAGHAIIERLRRGERASERASGHPRRRQRRGFWQGGSRPGCRPWAAHLALNAPIFSVP